MFEKKFSGGKGQLLWDFLNTQGDRDTPSSMAFMKIGIFKFPSWCVSILTDSPKLSIFFIFL